ncbi:hypothetical protein Glove_469g33 [Diversispora epigaea]|uniref:Uncharacterized protein n=1 Tax=Diversispora epigaea TaxID=1348612 RepID=A0A397GQN9_9GLOM|nr:hypothetical protein Glove_469g33 [Diversispora epigaea]
MLKNREGSPRKTKARLQNLKESSITRSDKEWISKNLKTLLIAADFPLATVLVLTSNFLSNKAKKLRTDKIFMISGC